MTPDQTERVARWWAERLGDFAVRIQEEARTIEGKLQWTSEKNYVQGPDGERWHSAAEYLNDMNTAVRAYRETLAMAVTPSTEEALADFPVNVFEDCPRALHDLAVACGMPREVEG